MSSSPSSPLESLSDALADAVARAGRATVALHARRRIPASGVLWRPGLVVATHHTVHRDDDVPVAFAGGARARASVVGRDPGTDLCVLRLAEGAAVGEAVPADVERTPLRVGQLAVAVGRPGDEVTAALALVSAVGPAWRTWQGGHVEQFVRLDAAIYDGFSGGPLVSSAGRVLGVNTSALARGAGLTLPAATVDRVVDQLLAGGRVRRGWLGIGTQAVRLPEAIRARLAEDGQEQTAGLMLVSVAPGGPAEHAGLVLGDVLLALDGRPTPDVDDVLAALGPDSPGTVVRARLLRAGELRTLPVTVGEPPAAGRAAQG
jgi:S1-C subfamily serine protease